MQWICQPIFGADGKILGILPLVMVVIASMTPFAEWLNAEMKARGINKNQLAAFAGMNPSVVGSWFTKDVIPLPPSCSTLARYLRIPVEDVLRRAGHLPALAEEPAPYDAGAPEWAALLPMLSRADAEYVGRLVQSLVRNPAVPDDPAAPGSEPSPGAPR